MRFTKMNGAGNDFILLDAIAEPFDESAAPALARALCDRRRSVGADGLMLVTRGRAMRTTGCGFTIPTARSVKCAATAHGASAGTAMHAAMQAPYSAWRRPQDL